MKILKQTIWDWYNQNKKNLKAECVFCNCNAGKITLKYPDGFTWELRAEDFPMRNREYEHDAIPREGLKPSFVRDGRGVEA
jgi:hypothetical protein